MTRVVAVVLTLLYSMGRASQAQPVAAPELAPNLGWLNTDRPLRLSDELKGHVVVLDFWTFCCINCMQILPDLEHLEQKYKDQPVVVIGVHSAKFENESQRESIRNAVQRYKVRHPVVVDFDFAIWNKYGARGWPSFVVIGPDGNLVSIEDPETGRKGLIISGEGNRDALDAAVARALEEGRTAGTLAASRFSPRLDAEVRTLSGLSFPGRVVGAPGLLGGRLFVSDSGHDRVLELTYPDANGHARLIRAYGAPGVPALVDGSAAVARFHEPQGLAIDTDSAQIYVADRRNHAVRVISLADGAVRTLVGDGQQSHDRVGGGAGAAQRLGSPWDLVLERPAPGQGAATLYVAMAGTHQIWTVDPESGVAIAAVGSGRENIQDGAPESASLAQPSGLALSSDGARLYFADSETSSIRFLDLKSGMVETIIGQGLFDYGDVDGEQPLARLQHPLGVAVWPGEGGAPDRLLVADTYNHKLKLVRPAERSAETWLGVKRDPGQDPRERIFDEPGGLCFVAGDMDRPPTVFVADTNNHRVVVVDAATRAVRELVIEGLDPVKPDAPALVATPISADVRPGASFKLALTPTLAPGAHLNAEAPVSVRVLAGAPSVVVAQRTFRADELPIEIDIPAAFARPGDHLRAEVYFTTCTTDDNGSAVGGLCTPGAQAFDVSLVEDRDGTGDEAPSP